LIIAAVAFQIIGPEIHSASLAISGASGASIKRLIVIGAGWARGASAKGRVVERS